jgi:hypothetical protein
MAHKASEGFSQRVMSSSSIFNKNATYANFMVLSSSVKVPAQLILLHMLLYFEQSFENFELTQ